MSFYFMGEAPLSKSLLNRALIIKSWFPDFYIEGSSDCDDVQVMSRAIENLKTSQTFDCNLSATALRFLAVRLSREKGEFFLTGKQSLLSRPFQEISSFLSQLGVQVSENEKGWLISSEGWKPHGASINMTSQVTSQYASAFLLNSWNFEKDLFFFLDRNTASYSYFKMTMDLVKHLGLEVKQSDQEFFIPKQQKLKVFKYKPEQDKSCLFALAVFSALKGKAIFTHWEEKSLQPDHIFVDILKKMGVPIQKKDHHLIVSQCENLKPISIDLKNTPDLFPLLSILCAKADGVSELSNIGYQQFKESPRLHEIKNILNHLNIKTETKDQSFFIYGKRDWPPVKPFSFDVTKDHRIAMATELVRNLGAPVSIQGVDSVKKSFPQFLSLVKG